MGRFESTVDYYANREPYPPLFFETLAQRLALGKQTRLLDIGTGPGLLAIGFAPFVGSCVAVDLEPAMLRVARASAAAANVDVKFVEASIEDQAFEPDSFDFVTIGRALHWLALGIVLPLLEKVVVEGGSIAICGSRITDSPANAWAAGFKALRKAWSDDPDEIRHQIYREEWFASSRFRNFDEIGVTHRHAITIPELLRRAVSFSATSPAMLGEKRPRFEAEVAAAVEPFAQDGVLEEELVASAVLLH